MNREKLFVAASLRFLFGAATVIAAYAFTH